MIAYLEVRPKPKADVMVVCLTRVTEKKSSDTTVDRNKLLTTRS